MAILFDVQKTRIHNEITNKTQSINLALKDLASTFKCKAAGIVIANGPHNKAPKIPKNLSKFPSKEIAMQAATMQTKALDKFLDHFKAYLDFIFLKSYASIIAFVGWMIIEYENIKLTQNSTLTADEISPGGIISVTMIVSESPYAR